MYRAHARSWISKIGILMGTRGRPGLGAAVAILAFTLPTASAQTVGGDGGYAGPARHAVSRPIAIGTRLESQLSPGDPTFHDSSHFQVWKFSARTGADLVVALESRDFDGFLMLVTAAGDTDQPLQVAIADSGKRARLSVRVPSDGEYLIVANTMRPRATGRYELTLETLAAACAAGGPCAVQAATTGGDLVPLNRISVESARALALGDSLGGELAATDAQLRDSSRFDAWRFEGRAGERVVIDHASSDFDAYLILARQTENGPESIRENDDVSGHPNSQLAVELPQDGTYVIVATSLQPNKLGRYTLHLRAMADACAAGGPCEPVAAAGPRAPLFASVRTAPNTPIALGDRVSARLTRSDATLGDGTSFDAYRFTGAADQEVAILLSALPPDISRFDTFLHLVRVESDSIVRIKSDDDAGAGTNSMVTARLPASGEYIILANGLGVADTGNYSLSLLRLSDVCESLRVCEIGAELPQASPEATILAAPATAIALGDSIAGRLATDGPRLPDGKPFQPWKYTARAGERVVITNRSEDFDAYLYLYRVTNGSIRELERDDDGGGSLDAQISVELAEAGDYLIVAGSFSTSAIGDYRLSLEDMRAACAAGGPCAVGETSADRDRLLPALAVAFAPFPVGDTVSAELPLSAPQMPGRGRFQSYRFEARAGERIVVTMDAEQFDPYLDLALVRGSSLSVIGSDDDGGEGVNARLVATLPESGTYLLVASALSADSARGAGPYTLARGPCDDACAADDGTPAVRSPRLPGLVLRAERRTMPRSGVVADSLTAADARRNGATFHAFSFEGTAGQTLRASLQSVEFDPFLVVLRLEGDSLRQIQTDDDGGEGTNSLVEWEIDRAGTYVIVAASYSGSSTGSYILHVAQGSASDGAAFAGTVAAAGARAQLGPALAAPHRTLPPGAAVAGEFSAQAPRLPGKGRFQAYRFTGRANERVVITMESRDTDPYVYLASVDGDAVRIVGTDDDGGDGVNSRLVATLPAAGEYLVVATAYASSDTARVASYTIMLAPCDDACAAETEEESSSTSDQAASQRILAAPRRAIQLGVPVLSALAVGDSTLADGSYFHAYTLEAAAGAVLRASMESSAFDTFLYLYRVQGDSLVRVTYDDDSGEDTNSLIEWTVDTTGSYILVANALARDSRGEYTLTVSQPPARARTH
ncbi:MAG: hypothetical protein NUW01_19795 [Gemmatimonadaceae bacterium]|nr:hypothetical protein [Gemmatimonadaceae bacterium]